MSETAAKQNIAAQPIRADMPRTEHAAKQPGGAHDAVFALQRAAGNRAVSELLTGESGTPLDPATRGEMEAKFGHDFNDVRIHEGRGATNITAAAGARALTRGRDIAFNRGFYSPRSTEGRRLIAHELAHVVQQSRQSSATPRANAESEARSAGEHVISGRSVQIHAAAAGAQADPLTSGDFDQQIADNEARAAQATNQQEIDRLFEERNELLAQRDAAKAAAAGPPATQGQAAAPAPRKNTVRIDYPADEHAYSGTQLEYAARGDYPTQDVVTPGVYKSRHYWLAPHLRAGTDKVVYYLAYNPETKRNEFVVGPDKVQSFLANEDVNWVVAAGAYPLVGDMPRYKALSGRVGAKAMEGDFSGAFQAWKDSWKAAVKDPQFWVESVTATAGAFSGGAKAPVVAEAGAVDSEVASTATEVSSEASSVANDVPNSTPAPPVTTTATTSAAPAATAAGTTATTTEEVFAELDKEMTSVAEGPGELTGTAEGGFESPQPLQTSSAPPVLRSPTKPGVVIRESAGASPRGSTFQSASAQTPRSMNTAIRADIGEAEAYKAALENGEIGLQRPGGANVPGADFITAVDGPNGIEVFVNDAKTSTVGNFPTPKGPGVKPTWLAEAEDAVKPGRLHLGDPALESRIQAAVKAGKVTVRQVNVNYSPAGQGSISIP